MVLRLYDKLLLFQSLVDLELDQVLVVAQVDLAVELVLQTHVVAVELAFDAEEAADVADSLDGLGVGVLEGGLEVALFHVLDDAAVVVEAWSRCDGDVASIGLQHEVSDAMAVLWKETQVGQLSDPVLDLITDEISCLHEQSPSQP